MEILKEKELIHGQYKVQKLWRNVTLLLDLSTGRQVAARPIGHFTSRGVIRVLEQVVHPSIPRVLGNTQIKEQTYVLVEYLPGDSLASLLTRPDFSKDPAHVVSIMWSVARTVGFLHDCLDPPLVHLDIKPENIILSGGTPCLIDFCTAVLLDPARESNDRLREATPAYAAPETLIRQQPCIQSDIYSLGVTMFHMLGGPLHPPGQLPDLSSLPRTLCPEALRPVIRRCLSFDPADRYPDMSSLASDLSTLVYGQHEADLI